MKFADLTDLVGCLVCFDLPLLVQAFPDRRSAVRLQLSRWATQGKVILLRRGVYALADRARKIPLDPALLAQHLCRPSYLSGLWALGFHDMIPERVVLHTSVTTRLPARFENACGSFEYRHIKPSSFFGHEQVPYGGGSLLVAHPEKALCDHWHLSARFKRPRLDRAVERWLTLAAACDDGDTIL